MNDEPLVTVIGCGAIGLPLAVAFASRDVDVEGIEIDEARLQRLTSGTIEIRDDGLPEALAAARKNGRLRFHRSLEPLARFRVFFVAVPTPVDEEGHPVRTFLDAAFEQILGCARSGDLVISRSAVPLGTTRTFAATAADFGLDLHVAACPDRSLAGHSFRDQFSIPNVFGAASFDASRKVADILGRLGSVHDVGSPEAAELLKLFCNVQRDVTFALANQFALICERLDLSFHDIVRTGSDQYPRFKMTRPGPVGGPCLSKDAYLLADAVDWRGDLAGLALAGRHVNLSLLEHLENAVSKSQILTLDRPIVAILGLAFKGEPATRDQRGSFGALLVQHFRALHPSVEIRSWDPEIDDRSKGDSMEVVDRADLVIVANDHFAMQNLDLEMVARAMKKGGLIIGMTGILKRRSGPLPNEVALHLFGDGAIRASSDGSSMPPRPMSNSVQSLPTIPRRTTAPCEDADARASSGPPSHVKRGSPSILR